jgi:hypothetical protein
MSGPLFGATPVAEASMIVTGTITVNPDGSVRDYTLHDQASIPPAVVQIVSRTIGTWRFEPVTKDNKAIVVQAGMAVRVVVSVADKEHATMRVASESFGCSAYQAKSLLPDTCPPDTTVAFRRRQPPEYPIAAMRQNLGGEVYLAVEVGKDGRVNPCGRHEGESFIPH